MTNWASVCLGFNGEGIFKEFYVGHLCRVPYLLTFKSKYQKADYKVKFVDGAY